MRKHLIAVIILALAGVASAEPPGMSPDVAMTVDAPPADRVMSDKALHFDVGIDSSLGRFHAGDMTSQGMIGIMYGFRVGRWTLSGDADFAQTAPDAGGMANGRYIRVGFEPRLAVIHHRSVMARAADGTPTEARVIDVWVAPGVGQSLATQEMGPVLHREDVSAGIGFTALRQHATYAWGGFVALRVIDSGFGDQAPRDVSLMLSSGFFFGH
ncbi:MAG TPA: hypothetical protein VGG28_14980 [Kofleriaceae bacterium]|jgi:hypothetical protein